MTYNSIYYHILQMFPYSSVPTSLSPNDYMAYFLLEAGDVKGT